MNLWHKHNWQSFHPFGYQESVRMFRCKKCGQVQHHGVRGQHGIIPLGIDAETGRVLFGGKS